MRRIQELLEYRAMEMIEMTQDKDKCIPLKYLVNFKPPINK